jgi:uncharacterized OB-fold protein
MTKPVPVPDDTTSFYWEAAKLGRLEVQRCAGCGSWWFPPVVACPKCGSDNVVATPVSGRGRIYSYTVVQQAFDHAFVDDLPYTVALVELEEDPAVRILTNLVNCSADSVTVGMAVRVTFESRREAALPVFEPC